MLPLKKRGEFDPSIEAVIDCVCVTLTRVQGKFLVAGIQACRLTN